MNAPSIGVKPLIGLLAVLVLGVLLGSLITWKYLTHKLGDYDRRNPNAAAVYIKDSLNSELGLSEDQQSQILAILQTRITELRTIRKQIDPQLTETRGNLQKDIRAVLDAKQSRKFDDLLSQYRRPFLMISGPPPLNESSSGTSATSVGN